MTGAPCGGAPVFNAAGKRVRTLYDNAPLKEALAEAGLPVREFFTFTTERGDELNGYMLKPLDNWLIVWSRCTCRDNWSAFFWASRSRRWFWNTIVI